MSAAILAVLFDADGVVFRTFDESSGLYLWKATAHEDIGLTEDQIGICFEKGFIDVITGKIGTMEYFEKVFETEPYKHSRVNAAQFVDYWLTKDSRVNEDTIAIVDLRFRDIWLQTKKP